MGRKILKGFFILAALFSAYICYQIYDVVSARARAGDVPQGYGVMSSADTLTVVEFLDYSCQYCQQVHPIITEAVKRDGRVRYIPRPIALTKESSLAGMLVYNAGKQGKFMEAHNELITNYKPVDEVVLEEFVKKLGLNQNEFDSNHAEIYAQLNDNMALFKALGGRGTPSFLIGDDVFFTPQGQMPSADDFIAMFNAQRARQAEQ